MAWIYKITNTKTNKVYVGQTTRTPGTRKCEHWWHLENNTHKNLKLQNSWNKWGPDSFTFEVLEECLDENRGLLEVNYIQYFDSYHNGYNLTPGGETNISNEKEIHCYNINGEYITSYKSLSECSRQTGISISNIFQAVHNRNGRFSCRDKNGIAWMFSYQLLDKIATKKITRTSTKTAVYEYETGKLFGEYKSVRSAALDHGLSETFAHAIMNGSKTRGFSKKEQTWIVFVKLNK